ncbi:hypothetical protein [Gordonia rhizosphera]|uniref:Uncharacterized protein n=1 Tax=Gordonia rhizosphera NBRC 16068 TaxID=1108045 RepID=K6WV04_9ACTN|nr:hypothetical protein [Gordonia rhizosphera]GAB90364.1 hypothetical protein GORHZ_098_00120 [Gordonia rhizosphera NBRC 16068]
MRAFVRSISFSYIGYMLLLAAFALLGLFVVALDSASAATAWGYGVASFVALVLSVAAFRFEIHESLDTQPGDPLVVHADPLIPAEERAELEWYEHEHPHNRDLTHAA